jgi:hypothetical protein
VWQVLLPLRFIHSVPEPVSKAQPAFEQSWFPSIVRTRAAFQAETSLLIQAAASA